MGSNDRAFLNYDQRETATPYGEGDGLELSFDEWMKKVDEHIDHVCFGLTSSDLDDELWRDMYDDGFTPEDAARQALARTGYVEDEE